MKKYILIFAVLSAVLFLASCSNVANPPTTTVPPPPSVMPPQPITFDNLEAAAAFLQNPDYSNYRAKWESTYQQMVADFASDGYLLTASNKTASVSYDDVTLYPCVQYEDVGVSYWFDLDGESYQVLLYNTKAGAEYTIDLETQNIIDYHVVRFGVSEDAEFEQLAVDHPNLSQTFLSLANNHICALSMLDDTHFIRVTAVTDTDSETLKDFIEGLIIEQHSIEPSE